MTPRPSPPVHPMVPMRRLHAVLAACLLGAPCAQAGPPCTGGASGRIVAIAEHRDAEVWTIELSNGVVAHLRQQREPEPRTRMVITLGLGILSEGPGQRGMSEALAAALSPPLFDDLDERERALLMRTPGGAAVEFGASATHDALTITAEADAVWPAHLPRLAHEVLAHARIDPSLLRAHLATERARLSASGRSLPQAYREAYESVLLGRALTPDLEDLDAITPERLGEHLERLRREAPIEIAITTPLAPEQVIDALRVWLGPLPARAAPSSSARLERHAAASPSTPMQVRHRYRAQEPVAAVVRTALVPGMHDGLDESAVRRVRALLILGEIADGRLEREPALASATTRVDFVSPFPGAGTVGTVGICRPEDAERAALAIERVLLDLAEQGPTPEELVGAIERLTARRESWRAEPWYWARALAKLRWNGFSLDALAEGPEAYARLTAEDLRAVAAETLRPERGIAIDILPE